MNVLDQDSKSSITVQKPAFELERKLSDNVFVIQMNAGDPLYAVRLFPFGLFEIDNAENFDCNSLEGNDFAETKPFSYFQPLLILTNQCNLACTYCYADEGSYGMKQQTMSLEVIGKTVDYLKEIITTKYAPNTSPDEVTELGLICFGGEPLIAMSAVEVAHKQLSDLCENLSTKHNTQFVPTLTINTNGFQVKEETFSFLEKNSKNIELVVSYDGWTHDVSRKTLGGRITSDRVLKNIFRLHEVGVDVSVTTCVLPESVDCPERLLESLECVYKRGIPVNLSFIRGPLEGVSERALYPGFVQEQYESSSLDAFGDYVAGEIRKGAPIYSRRFRRRLLEGGYRFRCGAGLFEFAVTPDGSVYPCHNFVSDRFALGNINDKEFTIPENDDLLLSLQNRKVANLKPCSECVFQSTCMSSFDCPAHSMQDLRDIGIVDDRFCGFARKVQKSIFEIFIREQINGNS